MEATAEVQRLLAGEANGRQQEMAVRFALGAGTGRVVRQLLTESAWSASSGASAGLFVAWLATGALLSLAPPMPRLSEVGVNLRSLLFRDHCGRHNGGCVRTRSHVEPHRRA
jgi:hypothetical protein